MNFIKLIFCGIFECHQMPSNPYSARLSQKSLSFSVFLCLGVRGKHGGMNGGIKRGRNRDRIRGIMQTEQERKQPLFKPLKSTFKDILSLG